MRRIPVVVAAACAFLAVCSAGHTETVEKGAPVLVLGVTPPGDEPEPFLPDIILDGVHSAPAFTSDGTEMYWSRYYTPEGRRSRTQHIFVSRRVDGEWSAPDLVSFSGRYADGEPFLTRDGSKLFFYSSRPAEPGGSPSDEYISDIWYVERAGEDWGDPKRLSFNTDKHEGMASVAANGNIYFQSNRSGTRGVFDVYVSRWTEGRYAAPQNLGSSVNCLKLNSSPLVAPDESFIILAYNGNAANNGLHISFREANGGWSKPVGMGSKINAGSTQRFPGLTPDGKYLFFARSVKRKRGVYWVDAGIIEELREQVLGN